MIELLHQIEQIDTQIFLFFNGFHNVYWDYFMMIFSDRFVWVPFYASFIFVLLKNFPVKVVMSTIVVITLIILFSDQTASGILKPLVARMRPSNPDNPISPMVHVVQGYRGGRYGFPSSHAANAWSMAFFAQYLVRRSKLTIFLCLWALITSYSRMYLGVQYFLRKHTERFKPNHDIRFASVPIITGLVSIWVIICTSGILAFYSIPLR